MSPAERNQTALDLLENVKSAAKGMAQKTGRPHDVVTAELLAEAVIRRPTDIAWLRVVVPQSPELAAHLLPYFRNERWLTETVEQKRGIGPKEKALSDYVNEACWRSDEAQDLWQACKARANAPGARYSDRLEALCAHAELNAGGCLLGQPDPAQAHRDEQLINALSAILTCLCVPDAGSAEPFEGTQPIWGEYPAGFDGCPYERLSDGQPFGFEIAADEVNWVH